MLRSPVRVLGDADAAALLELCDRDPVANVFVAGRVALVGCEPRRLGGELWGYVERGELVSACWAGANLVPVQATDDALDHFAARARRQGRRCSSMVGPADAVLGLWERLSATWAPARDVRPDQQLMVCDSVPPIAPDPDVRRTSREDLDVLVPACVEMFTEEVGYSPVAGDGGRMYRRRVEELVTSRRSFARIDSQRVVFKAELGAVSRRVAQVQGVWVPPELRGRGLASRGMAAVVALTRCDVDVVSLYVNSYNAQAVSAYERAGFRRVGTFATVLF
ncbi:MAG TPA: GNAT family N-acetyltransferase [Actinomycetales bacterium]|nr:GNAT family N-acetyltransferase [Actinomycetales bacterium]